MPKTVKKKRGPPIRFHDEYHRVHRERVRRSRSQRKRKKR